VGRAGRVAHIVPEARPFVGALYAALTASQQKAKSGHRKAPPGRVATRRFVTGATWLQHLLHEDERAPFELRRTIYAISPPAASTSSWSLRTDASPWGGGAAIYSSDEVIEYTSWVWTDHDAAHLGVVTGDPAFQTFWELLAVALALELWGKEFTKVSLAVLNDNTAALQGLLDLAGKGIQLAIARELAWRKAKFGWQLAVGHLPAEQNTIADSLSRLSAPDAAVLPEELEGARRREAPSPADFWKLRA
jgi:hypothetical protein